MKRIALITLLTFLTFGLIACTSKQKVYDEAIADFYTDSDTAFFFTALILDSYSSTWSSAIKKRTDFNIALAKDVSEHENMIEIVNQQKELLSEKLKVISEAKSKDPEKYEEIYSVSKNIYSHLSSLIEQANSPTGSLMTFNANKSDLAQKYKSERDILEALLSDEVKEIIEEKEKEKKKEAEEKMNENKEE